MTAPSGATALHIDVALEYRLDAPTPLLLAIEALSDGEQRLVAEELTVNGLHLPPVVAVRDGSARYRWLDAPAGDLSIRYRADLVVDRPAPMLFGLPLTALADLPTEAAPWLFASRHCDPGQFARILSDDMNLPLGWVADGSTVQLIRDWIRDHIAYQPVSDSDTSATHTYVTRAGVCRDFAHLMIALARAAGVPARFVSCYAWQLDPPDFHAVAELWLNGRWHLVDATGMAPEATLVRIARTADAVDASFLTSFGPIEMLQQTVLVSH
jgi:transglutaminase-like putative cysteine protease